MYFRLGPTTMFTSQRHHFNLVKDNEACQPIMVCHHYRYIYSSLLTFTFIFSLATMLTPRVLITTLQKPRRRSVDQ